MQLDLTQRVALITGGGRGIGRAIATTLANAGATVIVNYSTSADAATETVAAITESGGSAQAVQADIRKPADVERLVSETHGTHGRIDILVNNAGITRDGLLLRMKEEDFDSVLETNLRGVYLCTRAVLRPMLRQRSGRIINISSVVGIVGNVGQANYAAAKAGTLGFTRSIAREVANRNITVNAIAPGFIETDMTHGLDETTRQALLSSIPLRRLGTSQDVANLACFLASDAAAYITGQTLTVDGGMVMA
jgi:3-oxoacyl-[acyl-carrier protein] reductase